MYSHLSNASVFQALSQFVSALFKVKHQTSLVLPTASEAIFFSLPIVIRRGFLDAHQKRHFLECKKTRNWKKETKLLLIQGLEYITFFSWKVETFTCHHFTVCFTLDFIYRKFVSKKFRTTFNGASFKKTFIQIERILAAQSQKQNMAILYGTPVNSNLSILFEYRQFAMRTGVLLEKKQFQDKNYYFIVRRLSMTVMFYEGVRVVTSNINL